MGQTKNKDCLFMSWVINNSFYKKCWYIVWLRYRGKYFSLFPPKLAGTVLKNWPSWEEFLDANESRIAEFVRLCIFFTNISTRPSKMIKMHNFCKGSAWFSLTNDKGLGNSFCDWREEFQKFGEIFTPVLYPKNEKRFNFPGSPNSHRRVMY